MENELKVESGKLDAGSRKDGKTESEEFTVPIETQLDWINEQIKVLEKTLDLRPWLSPSSEHDTLAGLAPLRAIKENLLAIRNIEASGQTLAYKEREAGVEFDTMVGVFKAFIEDVWKMRYAQKDPQPNAEQLLAYEQEVDECLSILIKDETEP